MEATERVGAAAGACTTCVHWRGKTRGHSKPGQQRTPAVTKSVPVALATGTPTVMPARLLAPKNLRRRGDVRGLRGGVLPLTRLERGVHGSAGLQSRTGPRDGEQCQQAREVGRVADRGTRRQYDKKQGG
jgi:hypothetical protein